MDAKILLVDGKSRPQHYEVMRNRIDTSWIDARPDELEASETIDCDLALVSDEFCCVTSTVLRKLSRLRIPTLHVVDGIVEWRNTWENPRSHHPDDGLPLFQPVLADKIACLGRSQARIFESWGNLGRCEVVGSPRLDPLLDGGIQQANGPPARILVMTANTPAFTDDQHTTVVRALADLQRWFDDHPTLGGSPVDVVWRLTGDLPQTIGSGRTVSDKERESLSECLQGVAAVISTPSTAMLEAMLLGRPVAMLDYHNLPPYVQASWTIGAASQIGDVVSELLDPPRPKMLHQDFILHESLECRSAATPRMAKLMKEMVDIGRECRRQERPLAFPAQIIREPNGCHHLPEEKFDLQQLYPAHNTFSNMDRTLLQAELGHAYRRLGQVRKEVNQLQGALYQAQNDLSCARAEVASMRIRARLKRLALAWLPGQNANRRNQYAENCRHQ